MKAMTLLYDDWDQSYNKLPHLLHVMEYIIPGTIVHPGKRVFEGLFWAFKSQIEGFRYCKHMVQLDGTFLYGVYKHILMIAVAQDGDRNIFPIAFAIVKNELLAMIDRPGSRWSPPHAVPAYYIRHIDSNVMPMFKNKKIKKDFINMGRRYGHITTKLAKCINSVLKGTRHLSGGKYCLGDILQLRCRNIFLLKNSLIPSFLPAKQSATAATTHVGSFHSTPVTCEKRKNKGNSDKRSTQQPTKDEGPNPIWKFDAKEGRVSDCSVKKNRSREDFTFRNSDFGFEWREKRDWTNQRTEEQEIHSETESEDESYAVGSCSDRAILGLPLTGRLKLEDVKKAFRLSALKWHPDKHQGPSQAMAEEKFKTCAAAYKSLCHALA
ncbi:potassium channel SKOR-like [Hibiscus syriacus]|uniref:Potassium channel SKOR-like n=1 Tax=Hibiscus syriacus TaxID=106335 RepID=A0A6A2ZHP4_HIBSY|nr:potassium channel SKOR-like [Hibiscus syriacus]